VEGLAPATFRFSAHITGGTEPYTISWNFGNGSEGSQEQSVEHTFDEAGTYNVAVIVTDSDGETASDSLEITVEEASAEEGEGEQ
jgi:PKD repeat protein